MFMNEKDSDFFINQKLKEKTDIRVLDIGTGNGLFIKNLNEAYGISWKNLCGISAKDYRLQLPETTTVPDVSYRIQNIETIEVNNFNKFDLIFSSHCFNYLYDPIGTLSLVFELLNENGSLFIDSLGVSIYFLEKLVKILKRHDYRVDFQKSNSLIPRHCLMITRTQKGFLKIPLAYVETKLENKTKYEFLC
ncbi:MAG: hypothetical protein S4CHLAM6_10210 [Chlamydiae bacterium]|nr:hypothetical protein [Chlamydiota bacterium]